MPFSNIIFDLDGTLVDSLAGIESSARYAADKTFKEPRLIPPMRELIGPPIAKMFSKLWPDLTGEESTELLRNFRLHYDSEGCLLSELYPGVRETLARLFAREVSMFVLTNKPLEASRKILGSLGILSRFRDVVAPDSLTPAYSAKVDGAKYLRGRFELDPSATVIVGDGRDDYQSAEACGFAFILAAYGYGSLASCGDSADLTAVKTFPRIESLVL